MDAAACACDLAVSSCERFFVVGDGLSSWSFSWKEALLVGRSLLCRGCNLIFTPPVLAAGAGC